MLRPRSASELSFDHGEHHSAIVIFVAMIVALLLAAGAALDYARVSNMREGIEAAARAASEAGMNAMHDASLTDAEIQSIVLSHFDKGVAFARHVGTIEAPSVSIDRAAEAVTVDAKGTVAMTVSRLCGINEIFVPAKSTAARAARRAYAQ